MWVKDTISGFFWNNTVQAWTFWAWLEWVNMLTQNYLGMWNPAFWEAFWAVKESVDGVLNYTWANSLMAANPALTAWLSSVWAWLLSNTVLKDIWLNDDWAWVKSLKNLSRYALNAGAMVWTYSAWTAAAPYLIAGAWAYFAWKYGWKFSRELWKRWLWTAWGLTGWLVKWAAKSAWKWIKWEQKLNPQF